MSNNSKNNKTRHAKINKKPNNNQIKIQSNNQNSETKIKEIEPQNKSNNNHNPQENNDAMLANTEIKRTNITNNKTNKETDKSTNSVTSGVTKTQTRPLSNHNEQTTKQDIAHYNNETHQPQPKKDDKKKNIISACVIFGVTFLVAILGTVLGGKMVDGRTNPPAYPPEILFPIAWSILYILIALATFLVYKNSHDKEKRKCDMVWYLVHLFFNLFWPMFFFRLDMLIVSTIWLLFMVITAIVLTFKYFKNNLVSGTLFTIYTLWLLYAMYLNLGITLLNVA